MTELDAALTEDGQDPSEIVDLLAKISARFVSMPSEAVDREIEAAQGELCCCLKVDRCSLWQVLPDDPHRMPLTHGYGLSLYQDIPKNVESTELYPYLSGRARQGLTTVIQSIADLPAQAAKDRETLHKIGAKSLLVIPLLSNDGVLYGALSFGTIHRPREWSPQVVSRCQLAAQIFAGVLARNRLELALRQSEARFRAVVETSLSGTIFTGADGKILYLDPNYQKLTGYSDQERLGRSMLDLVHPDDVPGIQQELRRLLEDADYPYRVTYRLRHKNGSYRWMESTGRNLLANPNVRALVGSSRDITQTMEAEAVHQRYEMLAENTHDIVLFSRFCDMKILDGNTAALSAYGYTLEELRCLTLEQIRPAETRGMLRTQMQATLESAPRFESIHLRRDGSTFPVEIVALVKTIGSERVLMSVIRDISERHRREELARAQQDKLAHLSRVTSVGEMASGLAHDLNQPLTAILNYSAACVAMMQDLEPPRTRLHSTLIQLSQEARRAGEITNRWRSFVRDKSLEKQKVDLAAVLHEGVGMLAYELNRRGIELVQDFEPCLPSVELDVVLIQQVAVNLTQNAMDAMADNPPEKRRLVVRTLRPKASQARVEFEDRGPGVAESLRKTLFKSFVTTKPQGLGLGLAISRSIVESHGGHLDYRNNTPGGATFWFVIPTEA